MLTGKRHSSWRFIFRSESQFAKGAATSAAVSGSATPTSSDTMILRRRHRFQLTPLMSNSVAEKTPEPRGVHLSVGGMQGLRPGGTKLS